MHNFGLDSESFLNFPLKFGGDLPRGRQEQTTLSMSVSYVDEVVGFLNVLNKLCTVLAYHVSPNCMATCLPLTLLKYTVS